MGRRGPPPKPTALRVLHGSDLPINAQEPKPPLPPRLLAPPVVTTNKLAHRVWLRAAPILRRLQLLTLIDQDLFARYCVAQARWIEAETFLEKHGLTYPIKNPDGTPKYLAQWPQVSIARNYSRLATLLGSELGLSPAARTRIVTDVAERIGEAIGKEEDAFFAAR